MNRKPKDLPREELMQLAAETLSRLIAQHQAAEVFFKFTCAHCGERCMLSEPNRLYETGICCVCGNETTIDKGGFTLHIHGEVSA
jgi:hypothetical protein